MSDVLNSQDFFALHASVKRRYLQNSNIGAYDKVLGAGSKRSKLMVGNREHWKKSLAAGSRAPRQKGAGSIRIAVTKYKNPINNFS